MQPENLPAKKAKTSTHIGRVSGWAFWWALLLTLLVFEGGPRMTPPGWPIERDFFLMFLIPVGAVVMSSCTSLPGWALGLYGILGAGTFLLGQLGDSRLAIGLEMHGRNGAL
jgi:hypothetical protein